MLLSSFPTKKSMKKLRYINILELISFHGKNPRKIFFVEMLIIILYGLLMFKVLRFAKT